MGNNLRTSTKVLEARIKEMADQEVWEGFEQRRYAMLIQQDGDGDFVVGYPDLPGCMSHDTTIAKAYRRAESARRAWTEAALDLGQAIPEPTDWNDLLQNWYKKDKYHAERRLLRQANKHAAATAKICELVAERRKIISALEETGLRAKALGQVWSFLWRQFVGNPGFVDMDGADFQEIGEKAGLLHRVPFDPEQHGENVEADRGELIYVLTDLGKAAYSSQEKPAIAVVETCLS